MTHQEGHFRGVRDSKIYYQTWLPEGEPKASLMIVHGLAEHSGRYMNVVNYLVPLGFAVYGIDHIGHGKSEGERVFVEKFEEFTTNLKTYFDMIQGWQPGKPVFLVGHSLGGLIGAAYLLEYQDELVGAILSGPGIKVPENISPVTIMLGKLFSVLLPKSGLIQLDASSVSKDPVVVDAYVNDPLVYTGKTTARLAAEMLKTMEEVTANAAAIRLPILILQGSADKLVDPAGASMLYNLVRSDDKTLKVYDGLYHEVFNEPERAQVLADLEAWLRSHI